MIVNKSRNNRLKSAIFGVFFAVLSIFGFTTISAFVNPADVYAEPTNSTSDTTSPSDSNSSNNSNQNSNNSSNDSNSNDQSDKKADEKSEEETDENCYDQVGALGWFICPGVGVLSKAIDSIYSQIETLLEVNPVSVDDNSSIFYIWQIMRDITNILFVIAVLIIVYSQVTGLGITNYGIKKALPKLIIAAVLVNLSYIICALAVDASNIIGSSLRGLFDSIQVQAINSGGLSAEASTITWSDLTTAVIGGGLIAGFAISAGSLLFPIIGAILGAVISVLVGLITLGLRQSLVAVLIMISPVAFVCYLLPNTDKWFNKWKDTFISMLVFYPMFSLLFGASRLAGWALIATSLENNSAFGVVIGMLVQVLPLILAISLMKMSSTVLGKASSALDKLASRPREGIMTAAQGFRKLSHDRHVNNSVLPSAHLQRFLDGTKRKMAIDTENEATIRISRAEIRAQRRIQGIKNYDSLHEEEYKNGGVDKDGKKNRDNVPRANRSTRAAKEAMTAKMEAENVARNTSHILGNYGSYFKGNYQDAIINNRGARQFIEYDRTLHVEENDSFADQDWLMGQYEKMRKAGKDSDAYKRYIIGGAGALGEAGQGVVLGEVINKSALNESKRRSYTALNLAKYGYGGANKENFRDFFVGYSINDDGLAVDKVTRSTTLKYKDPKTGKTIQVKERSPGEFLHYHPEYLNQCCGYTNKDENGYYFDLTDQEGRFVTRYYKNDTASMKEILSNSDMPIADAVDGLYGLLSGTDPGTFAKKGYDALGGVGLSNFSTTIDRALRSSGFKEKAAFASPLYGTMANQRFIKNMIHQNLARLDSLNKTAKAGGFNIQDSAEFHQIELLMNEENWDWMLFDEDALRTFKNVQGRKLNGTRYKTDDQGNYIQNADGSFAFDEIAADSSDLTFEDLKNTVVRKFLAPAGQKFPSLMARITPNIIENQKPGVAEPWNNTIEAMKGWSDPEIQAKYPGLKDPMAKRDNDTLAQAQELGYQIGVKKQKQNRQGGGGTQPNSQGQPLSFTPNQTVSINNANSDEIVEASSELKTRKRKSSQRANGQQFSSTSNNYSAFNTQPTDKQHQNDSIQLTDEDYAVDLEYLENEFNDNNDDDDDFLDTLPNSDQRKYPNYIFEIERIASICETVDSFLDAVTDYIIKANAKDPRLDGVLDEFHLYVAEHSNDPSTKIHDYKDELQGIVSRAIYES